MCPAAPRYRGTKTWHTKKKKLNSFKLDRQIDRYRNAKFTKDGLRLRQFTQIKAPKNVRFLLLFNKQYLFFGKIFALPGEPSENQLQDSVCLVVLTSRLQSNITKCLRCLSFWASARLSLFFKLFRVKLQAAVCLFVRWKIFDQKLFLCDTTSKLACLIFTIFIHVERQAEKL